MTVGWTFCVNPKYDIICVWLFWCIGFGAVLNVVAKASWKRLRLLVMKGLLGRDVENSYLSGGGLEAGSLTPYGNVSYKLKTP